MKITLRGTSAQAWNLAAVLGDEGLDVEVEERVTESVGVTDVVGAVAIYVSKKIADKAFDVSLDELVERAIARFKRNAPDVEMTVERRDSSTDGSE